jgi:pullulanase
LADMPGVGAFNDEIRNAIRGGVFTASERGFVQNLWNESVIQRMKYGIVGGSQFPGIDPSFLSYEMFWGTNPNQTVNYVSAHDNNTLYDKLRLSTTFQQRPLIPQMQKQANAIVLLAQGIPFIHAGAEIMRSKPNANGIGYNHNSYNQPDSVNQIRWDQKAIEANLLVFNYYKDIIAFRKAHPAFRMETAAEVRENLEFVDFGTNSALGFLLKDYANGDSFETILVIHNSGDFNVLTLPGTDEWTLVLNQTGNVESQGRVFQGGQTIPLMENETVVLRSGIVVIPVEPTGLSIGWIIGIVTGSVALIGGVLFFLIKKGILKF